MMMMTAVAVVHHLVEGLLATVVVAAVMTMAMAVVAAQVMEAAAVLVVEVAEAVVAAEADMKAEVVNLRFFYLLCHQKSYILYNYK